MFKKSIKILLMWCMFILICNVLCTSLQISAKSKDTKEKALKAYAKILKENPYKGYDGGFVAETFQLIDIDGNGIPELIINDIAPQIFTYYNGEVKFLFNSWVVHNLYTSKETGNFMFEYSWNEVTSYYIYSIKAGEAKALSTLTYKDNKYYEYVDGKEKKISKKAFNKKLEKYMPNNEAVKTVYKNNKANRNKHLK